MRKHKFFTDNRHKFHHVYTPTIHTSQKQKKNIMGGTQYVTQNYNKDNRYCVLGGVRGYSKHRDYSGRNERYIHSSFEHTQNNNLTLRKPIINPYYYYESPAKSDYYKPYVQQHSSEITLTDVASYDEAGVSYRGSLVSVASSLDSLQDRIRQTHKVRQQAHHARLYPYSDVERRYSRTVHSLYNSDDQKRRHSDAKREMKDEKLRRRRTDETFSEYKTKNNNSNNQTLSYSVYNASINSNNNGKNKIPLMLFKKDEEKGSNDSDVVYIPVVILPEKQDNNYASSSNADGEREHNEQSFTKRKYFMQYNGAKDKITENEETINDSPNLLCNDTNAVYRKVDNDNLFKENGCPLLSKEEVFNRTHDRNIVNESLYPEKSIFIDNKKKTNNENRFNKLFPYSNGEETEKLQGIIQINDCEIIPKNDPLNVMVAKFDKIANPFSNSSENTKPTLPLCSRNVGKDWKKNVVQHSQCIQVSRTSIITTRDGAVQVSDIPKIITKDGEVQASEMSGTMIPENGEIMSNKLKGEKPGIISEDIMLPKPLSKGIKEKEHNDSKIHSEVVSNDSKSGSGNKFSEIIIQEINNLVNKISRGENETKGKGSEENNCCQRKVCKKENNSGRQSKNRQNNERKQFVTENLSKKKDYKEVPKNMNSSNHWQESYESPFRKLFGNDYKMISRPQYLKTGMYTDSPMVLENTYNWLTEPNKQFVESNSSNFRAIPKKYKNIQTAYPFFTKLKKKILSKDKLKAEKSADTETAQKQDEIEKEEEEKEEILQVTGLEHAEQKISKQDITRKMEESDRKIEKFKETRQEEQLEVNLNLIWDYIVQGFNLCLGKTVHTVLIDGIYTVCTVTERLQSRRN